MFKTFTNNKIVILLGFTNLDELRYCKNIKQIIRDLVFSGLLATKFASIIFIFQ